MPHLRPVLLALCMLASVACARTATLLPQSDASYKVVTLGEDLKEARSSAREQAEVICRRERAVYEGIAEDPPETMPDGQIRLRWRFRCVDRGY